MLDGDNDDGDERAAAAAFIAFFELILDAIPGGVLFFTTSLMAGGWYELNLGDSEVLGMYCAVVGCALSVADS